MTALLDAGTPTGAASPGLMSANAGRTVAALGALLLTLPVDLALVAVALAVRRRNPLAHRADRAAPRRC